jgi:LysM repeat protein
VPPAQPAQPGVEQTHVVQSGENLFRIGLSYGCSVLELSTYNGIANPNWISVGQVIRIPATCGG